jgi:hypothetical protein
VGRGLGGKVSGGEERGSSETAHAETLPPELDQAISGSHNTRLRADHVHAPAGPQQGPGAAEMTQASTRDSLKKKKS